MNKAMYLMSFAALVVGLLATPAENGVCDSEHPVQIDGVCYSQKYLAELDTYDECVSRCMWDEDSSTLSCQSPCSDLYPIKD